jgi:hypothetical protein
MPDTYAVKPADVAAELPGLFKDGFSQVSKPTQQQVASFISDADAIVTLHLTTALGTAPTATDPNARLAVRYILDRVKAEVLRLVYTGNDPDSVRAATQPYDDLADAMLTRIDALEAVPSRPSVGSFAMPSGTTCHTPSW